ncbi:MULTISPECIES: TonB-dependent receptor [unclassified Roseateles]|uniref:TonB-dependent receptor n=1 Tax=unclassified Roseateles TaxID=2626991 RepID=UPI0006F62380|nr:MULTISPECIES: TonB-dependent receptor [unclassified Roseateles]KQW45677.1 TonB-dependent receptor [Pelomonas sp. Root405]KRA72521.1 TonB-dependent receptor [Pelomonas sp. Root662]
MKFQPTPIACGLAGLLLSLQGTALAQQAPATNDKDGKTKQQLEAVVVTGIRASLESSLDAKRNASANVDVITAVDVGKMPDKNLADSLQRVVGVAVRTDYDEAEKVAMRGANPDMSLILFNGHTVSGGDWYLSDQASSSRSTSLSLMPSSVLNSATVYKTSQANIVDGGLAGTINVTTRKPLDSPKGFSGVVSAGGVYADLPGKTSPQLNASLNWKNEDSTLGFIGQVFAEKRYIRRDTASRFAYGANSGWDQINTATMLGITDASLAGSGYTAAQLNGVRLPGSMSTEFVEGVRDRKGGMFSGQFKPTSNTDVGLTGFYSKMNAANFGRATMGAIYQMLAGQSGPLGATTPTNVAGQRVYASIKNPVIVDETTVYGHKLRVLKSAEISYANGLPAQYVGDSEGFYRSGAYASSGFLDLDGKWVVSDKLTLKGLLSTTKGIGHTDMDRGLTYSRYGQGIKYDITDLERAPDFSWINAGSGTTPMASNSPAGTPGYRLTGRSGLNRYNTVDSEKSFAVDGEYTQDSGIFSSLNFGFRNADHRRQYGLSTVALKSAFSAANAPDPALAVPYPGDFGEYLDGNFDNSGFYFSKETLTKLFGDLAKQTNPQWERRIANSIDLREVQSAAYLMQNLDGERWSGNVGVRLVRTVFTSRTPVPLPAGSCLRIEPGKPFVPCAKYPDAIIDVSEGQSYFDNVPFNGATGVIYRKETTRRTFDDILPSLNLRYDFGQGIIGRLGLSKTIGRQNYNLYGATYSAQTCGSQGCTVTGPNPNLTPLSSRNLDISVAWYYAKRSMLALSAFSSLIDGYAKTGATASGQTVELYDGTTDSYRTYLINTSTQQKARIRGLELSWEQPIAWGFGFQSNASYAETRVEDGRPMNGASKIAGNAGVYFENDVFSARLVYNYRGEYVSSTTAPGPTANSQGMSTIGGVLMPSAPTIAAPVSNVAFSANYNVTPALQIAFSATNLTNPVRATYRYSEEEQQKVDASGRQYYLEARYKF